MSHRDQIIIQKILSEIDVGIDMMGKAELIKRAISMTVLNIGELVKKHYRRNTKRIFSSAVEGYCGNERYHSA